jgi:hypothetical protein
MPNSSDLLCNQFITLILLIALHTIKNLSFSNLNKETSSTNPAFSLSIAVGIIILPLSNFFTFLL